MKTLTFEDKPTKRVVRANTPHGVKNEIVVTVYPGGGIGLRELGRRKEYHLDAGALYVRAIVSELASEKRAKRGGRK